MAQRRYAPGGPYAPSYPKRDKRKLVKHFRKKQSKHEKNNTHTKKEHTLIYMLERKIHRGP